MMILKRFTCEHFLISIQRKKMSFYHDSLVVSRLALGGGFNSEELKYLLYGTY